LLGFSSCTFFLPACLLHFLWLCFTSLPLASLSTLPFSSFPSFAHRALAFLLTCN
jgi:hypothetical protein